MGGEKGQASPPPQVRYGVHPALSIDPEGPGS
jgi:hypothetical protein